MDRKMAILFAVLLVTLSILHMTHGGPRSMNVWEFFDWVSGRGN